MSHSESGGTGAGLARVVGLPGAVLLGLGSILGTGIFVGLGIAAGAAGPWVVLAAAMAALVAAFNGLSSAQLAASHPVSGGTYEYGYRYLNPVLGFTAGWMFLLAKSASAATAALGFAGYVLGMASPSAAMGGAGGAAGPSMQVPLALAAVLVLTLIVVGGMRRSNRVNAAIVSVTILTLAAFVLLGLPAALDGAPRFIFSGEARESYGLGAVLHGTALMFVAYTGYGRIATLGEEVRDPARSIPRAVVVTLLVSMALYVSVAFVAVGAAGAEELAELTRREGAPLEWIARGFGGGGLAAMVALGAVTAMLGVLLNLLLGLSRVVLAMARRGDVPRGLARLEGTEVSPRRAVWVVAGLIGLLTLTGSVQTTWSFSAFTVLIYYAITNLSALFLPPESRRYPRWIPVAGLASCLGLAFWVEPRIWGVGIGLLAVGLLWFALARKRRGADSAN